MSEMMELNLFGKEHYDLLDQFERDRGLRAPVREKDKEWWKRGYIYCNGEINKQFVAYRMGYTLGKRVAMDEEQS
jgi:uncharacterized membrane protein